VARRCTVMGDKGRAVGAGEQFLFEADGKQTTMGAGDSSLRHHEQPLAFQSAGTTTGRVIVVAPPAWH